jgi:hypothetical protein
MNKFILHKRKVAFQLLQKTILMNRPAIAYEAMGVDASFLNNRGANHILKKAKLIHDKLNSDNWPTAATATQEADLLINSVLTSKLHLNAHQGAVVNNITYNVDSKIICMTQQMGRVLASRRSHKNEYLDKVNYWRSITIGILENICSGSGKVDSVFVNMLSILKQLEKEAALSNNQSSEGSTINE